MNTDTLHTPSTEPQTPVVLRKFVRVQAVRDDGLVSFDFAIGWPELSVELMLPGPAFEAFCATHRVERLDGPADGR